MADKRHHEFADRDLSMTRERRTIPLMREFAAAAKDCPLAPPAHATVYARTLHRACLVLGGVQQLAKHLEVSDADLKRWLGAEEVPPERVFLLAVEIVLLNAEGGSRAN
jgi:hypothetical protein